MIIYSLSAELPKRVCGDFRCKICGGWIDARDYVWVEDSRRPVAASGAGSRSIGCAVDKRGPYVRWFGARRAAAPTGSSEIVDQKVSCGDHSKQYGDNNGSPRQGLAPAHKSSRIPLKNGWRTLPSADFARYSISASNDGSTQTPRCAIFLE